MKLCLKLISVITLFTCSLNYSGDLPGSKRTMTQAAATAFKNMSFGYQMWAVGGATFLLNEGAKQLEISSLGRVEALLTGGVVTLVLRAYSNEAQLDRIEEKVTTIDRKVDVVKVELQDFRKLSMDNHAITHAGLASLTKTVGENHTEIHQGIAGLVTRAHFEAFEQSNKAAHDSHTQNFKDLKTGQESAANKLDAILARLSRAGAAQ